MYEGKSVRLRVHRPEDAKIFAAWVNDLETMRQTANFRLPISVNMEREWLEGAPREKDACHFAVETLSGKLIGSCSYREINWQSRNCTVGWFIGDRSMRGKGYGSDMIRALLSICFDELDLHKVTLAVFEHNARAIALYERLGFVREGALREQLYSMGRRWDEYIYGMLRSEWEAQK